MPLPNTLMPMVTKLQLWTRLDDADRDAVLALPHRVRALRAHEFIVRDGDEPRHSCLILSGYAIRHKLTGSGGRQILSIHMKGTWSTSRTRCCAARTIMCRR